MQTRPYQTSASGIRVGIFFVLSLLVATAGNSKVSAAPKAVSGTILRLVDGDTVHFLPDGASEDQKWKIRMAGIDTPETHLIVGGKNYSQGYWGEAAADYLATLIQKGSRVDVLNYGNDRYGRVLGRIFLKGHDVHLAMVRSGWAIPYAICEGPTCNNDYMDHQRIREYQSACENARIEKRGIFSAEKPLKEMPFEFRMRVQRRNPERYVGDIQSFDLYAPQDYQKVDVCRRLFFAKEQDAIRLGFHY